MHTFEEYCKNLGSDNPTPGGGSAAGYTLSLGAACCEKAARFTKIDNIDTYISVFQKLVISGQNLAREDEIAFAAWQEARALPKSTEEEKNTRLKAVNESVSQCAQVPLKIAENAIILIETAREFIPLCSKWLISDVGVGFALGRGAFEASLLNIKINLPYIKDELLKKTLIQFLETNTTSIIKQTEEGITDISRRL